MAITDYKVTATPLTVGVGSAGDLLTGSTPAELAANKAIFDAFPDAIKTEHDDLIDYIDVKPLSFESTVAAATANKGSFSGWVPTGAIIDLIMTNGNTAAAPTITIDSVAYTISGMPTVAKMSTSTAQAYKLKKTGADTLVFVSLPDYVCEYGTSGEWKYERRSNGKCLSWGKITGISITSSGSFGSGGLYLHNGTFSFPSGLFNVDPEPFCSYSLSTVTGGIFVYSTSASAGGVQLLRSNATATTIGVPIHVIGTWR